MKNIVSELKLRKNTILVLSGLLITMSFCILAAPFSIDMIGAYRNDAALLKLIESSGAEFQSKNITAWVNVEQTPYLEADPEALVLPAAARLKFVEQGGSVESWQNPYARGARLEGRTENGSYVSVLVQTMELQKGEKVTHLIVSLDGVENGNAHYYRSKIEEAFRAYGGESHVALTCSGRIEGQLNGEELLAGAEKVMSAAGASILEKTIKDNLVSLTGFSPRLSGDIRYARKEVNLNVALRSNPVENATYVYVASPVIFTEY